MIQDTEAPVLIVGQGIAGTVLALEAHALGIDYQLLDDGHRSASSLAAAGLYNPFILKRRKLSWRADQFLPASREFFERVESLLGSDFDHSIGILRRIHDVEERNDWTAKQALPAYEDLLGGWLSADEVSPALDAPQGYQSVPCAGYVDTEGFLRRARDFFQTQGRYAEGRFSEDAVVLGPELSYEGEQYSRIIICIGYRSQEPGRFFPELPFSPAKGHTLRISCPDLELRNIVSGPCFILPLGEGQFRIGSTYSWTNFNETVEQQEVDKLLGLFEGFCSLPYELLEAKAGVRPATKDRRPLLGTSSVDARIQLYGGMGSRAIMCAPLLARSFWNPYLDTLGLGQEVALSRYGS